MRYKFVNFREKKIPLAETPFFTQVREYLLVLFSFAQVANLSSSVLSGSVYLTNLSGSVYLGAPFWYARALFRSKVDDFVPPTQHVNLRVGGYCQLNHSMHTVF